jgi:PAS domain S-box-containing protein
MKLFWKIFISMFFSFVVIVASISYIISVKQISNMEKGVIEDKKILGSFLSKEIEVGYFENKWPFESLKKLSGHKGTLFWWIVRPDGAIHLADNASFINTHAQDYFTEITFGPGKEGVLLNHEKNYAIFFKSLETGKDKWSFWFGFSLNEISARRKEIIFLVSTVSLSALVVLGGILYISIHHFTRPVKELTAGAELVGKGDLTHRVKVKTKDELGQLANSFNKMTENLQKTTVSRNQLEELVENRTIQLKGTNEQLEEEVLNRRKAEEALLVAQERLRFLVSNSPAVIFTMKASGDFGLTSVTENVANRFGYTPQDFLGSPAFWAEHIHPEDKPKVFAEFSRLFERGTHTYEYRFLHKDGTYHWIHDEVYLVRDQEGSPIEIIGAGMDITKIKQAEEKIKVSLREKGVLLKEIHHRVKNNLQIISSLFNLQSKYIRDLHAQEVIRESQNRVKSMVLIHEKLYQSKDLGRINVGEYAKNLVSNLLRAYGGNLNHVTFAVDTDDIFLNIDTAIPCGLILNELVSNSLKHAFPDGKEGEIRIGLHSENDHRFTLTVKDDGVGLPKDLDFRNTESLGLQLVNTLVDQLEGSINLHNSEGTSFQISFGELKYKERG